MAGLRAGKAVARAAAAFRSLPRPALTFMAAGGRPQHPQQNLPPAEEPHGAGRRPEPPPRPKGNRRSATGLALPPEESRRRAGRERRRGAAPSWELAAAAGAILVSGGLPLAGCRAVVSGFSGARQRMCRVILNFRDPASRAGFPQRSPPRLPLPVQVRSPALACPSLGCGASTGTVRTFLLCETHRRAQVRVPRGLFGASDRPASPCLLGREVWVGFVCSVDRASSCGLN